MMAAAAGTGVAGTHADGANGTRASAVRQPTIFVPHGGGTWPFVDLGRFIPARDIQGLARVPQGAAARLPARPKTLLVVSAHWAESVATVMSSPRPPILYDYGGFAPEAYAIQWPAPGNPVVAERSVAFDSWLTGAATAEPATRVRLLGDWTSAPGARQAQPREEHLLPLMIMGGAAGDDVGHVTFNEDWMGCRISAFPYE
jgi:aromatic ring-opening dioxygenase catalytic subunit (LigB family)